MMKTPGEVRYVSRSNIEESLAEGVKQGLFGLGEIQTNHDDKERPICHFFKEGVSVVDPNYVLMIDRICKAQQLGVDQIEDTVSHAITDAQFGSRSEVGIPDLGQIGTESAGRQEINPSFDVPRGKISHIMGILNLLQEIRVNAFGDHCSKRIN
jgi:hypothetical protein